jgi:hypothetical protein
MGAGRGVKRRVALSAAVAVSTGLALLSEASLAQQDLRHKQAPGPLQLRIASFNVAGKHAGPAGPQQSPAPAWRHTFGSERRAEAVRKPVRFKADLVHLHGVTNLAPVRQMFPARFYRIAASRQILQNAKQMRDAPEVATTALAIRRDTRLRAVAHDHLLELAEPLPDAAIPQSAAFAMRLLSPYGAFWVMSVDLVSGCSEGTPPNDPRCEAAKKQLDLIDDWLAGKQDAGETVIIAGRFHAAFGERALPGRLGQLTRFPSGEKLGGGCQVDEDGIARSYVLVAPGPRSSARVTFRGRVEAVDERKPEMGCVLLADVSF